MILLICPGCDGAGPLDVGQNRWTFWDGHAKACVAKNGLTGTPLPIANPEPVAIDWDAAYISDEPSIWWEGKSRAAVIKQMRVDGGGLGRQPPQPKKEAGRQSRPPKTKPGKLGLDENLSRFKALLAQVKGE